MPIFAQEGQYSRFSSLVKYIQDQAKPNVHNELVVVNEAAAKTYELGTVLGKVTATGKYKVSVATATDGSQVAAVIVIGDGSLGAVPPFAVPATTDTKVLTLARGKAIVAKEALKLDASFDTPAKVQAVYDALKAVAIFAESAN